MLHITNGDHVLALLRQAGITGTLLPWRDALHEGPVPEHLGLEALSALRARFIAEAGWAPLAQVERDFQLRDAALRQAGRHDETVLWFEHDLYDQLQLIQVLDSLAVAPPARLSLICVGHYLGHSSPAALAALFPARVPVAPQLLATAQAAWQAFRAPDPQPLAALASRPQPGLPFLAPALRRHLEEFPGLEDGLSRTERQMLEALAAAPLTPVQAFPLAHHQREDAWFLGDTVFYWLLARLAEGPAPLLCRHGGAPAGASLDPAFPHTPLQLTPTGRAVLAGEADRIALCGIDRWLGGVHQQGQQARWRWDCRHARLASTPLPRP